MVRSSRPNTLTGSRLSKVISTSVYADIDLDDVSMTTHGDYKVASLAHHVNKPAITDLIVRSYLHRAGAWVLRLPTGHCSPHRPSSDAPGDRRSTLVFAVSLRHVDALVAAFRTAGIDARSVSARTRAAERKDTIASFQAGDFPVLVNCEVLTEGTDIPEVSRPTPGAVSPAAALCPGRIGPQAPC